MTIKEFFPKNKPTILFFLFVLLSLIFLSIQAITEQVHSIRIFFVYFFSVSYIPVYKIVNYPFNTFNKFLQLSYMYEENMKLKELVKKFYMDKMYYSSLVEEQHHQQLVNELSKNIGYKLYPAEVIFRDCKNWYNECVVLVKSSSTLSRDMPVIVYVEPDKFYFVGRIWTIDKNIAKILLITNPLSMLPVKIKDKPIYGVLIGESSVKLSMDYLLLEDDVRIGDVVVTSSIGNLPGGIEIGRVIDVDVSLTGFKKAVVKLNYNINVLKNLIIVSF
jgi:rod shape-determining protein MreC